MPSKPPVPELADGARQAPAASGRSPPRRRRSASRRRCCRPRVDLERHRRGVADIDRGRHAEVARPPGARGPGSDRRRRSRRTSRRFRCRRWPATIGSRRSSVARSRSRIEARVKDRSGITRRLPPRRSCLALERPDRVQDRRLDGDPLDARRPEEALGVGVLVQVAACPRRRRAGRRAPRQMTSGFSRRASSIRFWTCSHAASSDMRRLARPRRGRPSSSRRAATMTSQPAAARPRSAPPCSRSRS